MIKAMKKYRVLNIEDNNIYKAAIQYALKRSEFLSLCSFKHHHAKDLNENYFSFVRCLSEYEEGENVHLKTPRIYTKGQQYHIYRITKGLEKTILSVPALTAWCTPDYPEDPTFYINDNPWIETISHEQIMYISTNDNDLFSGLLQCGVKCIEVDIY